MKIFVLCLFIACVCSEEIEYDIPSYCLPEPIYIVERVTPPMGYVEGLFWDNAEQRLYWVDSDNATIYRLTYATGAIDSHYLSEIANERVTCIIPVEGQSNTYVICSDGNLRVLQAYGPDNYTLNDPFLTISNKINKAHTDVTHRLIVSTAATEGAKDAQIINIERGQQPEVMLTVGRVVDFCIRGSQFWGVGHDYDCIHQFDYNTKYAILEGNQIIVMKLMDYEPNQRITGIEVDDRFNLWYLQVGNVLRWSLYPEHNNYTIPIPAMNLTTITFGGPELNNIYVGSSGSGDPNDMDNGCIYKITGMRGHGDPDYTTNIAP